MTEGAADLPPRRSLFRKYFLALFGAVVVPPLANGLGEAWFGYRDQRDLLDRLLRVEADNAAVTIENFLSSIRDQLGWTLQHVWEDGEQDTNRLSAPGLLRQVPAIMSLTLVDGDGRELSMYRAWSRNGTMHEPTFPARLPSSARVKAVSGLGQSISTSIPSLSWRSRWRATASPPALRPRK